MRRLVWFLIDGIIWVPLALVAFYASASMVAGAAMARSIARAPNPEGRTLIDFLYALPKIYDAFGFSFNIGAFLIFYSWVRFIHESAVGKGGGYLAFPVLHSIFVIAPLSYLAILGFNV